MSALSRCRPDDGSPSPLSPRLRLGFFITVELNSFFGAGEHDQGDIYAPY